MWMGDECNREWPVYGRRGRSLAGGAEKRKRVSEGGGHRRTRSCWTVQGVGTPLAAILMRLILVLLLLWFVLSSAKLVLDLIGRLWISVVLDFLQVNHFIRNPLVLSMGFCWLFYVFAGYRPFFNKNSFHGQCWFHRSEGWLTYMYTRIASETTWIVSVKSMGISMNFSRRNWMTKRMWDNWKQVFFIIR